MAPDYDHLTLMEKVEVFEHAVNNTAGDDLAKLLWLKSPSSEVCTHHLAHTHTHTTLYSHTSLAITQLLYRAARLIVKRSRSRFKHPCDLIPNL